MSYFAFVFLYINSGKINNASEAFLTDIYHMSKNTMGDIRDQKERLLTKN